MVGVTYADGVMRVRESRYKTAPSPTASARRLTDTVGARWPTRAGMAGAEQWREYKGEIRLGCFAPYIEMELNFGDCVL